MLSSAWINFGSMLLVRAFKANSVFSAYQGNDLEAVEDTT